MPRSSSGRAELRPDTVRQHVGIVGARPEPAVTQPTTSLPRAQEQQERRSTGTAPTAHAASCAPLREDDLVVAASGCFFVALSASVGAAVALGPEVAGCWAAPVVHAGGLFPVRAAGVGSNRTHPLPPK